MNDSNKLICPSHVRGKRQPVNSAYYTQSSCFSFSFTSLGASVTTHSAVERRDAIPAASIKAVLTTYKHIVIMTYKNVI